jgi:hypothetical protein
MCIVVLYEPRTLHIERLSYQMRKSVIVCEAKRFIIICLVVVLKASFLQKEQMRFTIELRNNRSLILLTQIILKTNPNLINTGKHEQALRNPIIIY